MLSGFLSEAGAAKCKSRSFTPLTPRTLSAGPQAASFRMTILRLREFGLARFVQDDNSG